MHILICGRHHSCYLAVLQASLVASAAAASFILNLRMAVSPTLALAVYIEQHPWCVVGCSQGHCMMLPERLHDPADVPCETPAVTHAVTQGAWCEALRLELSRVVCTWHCTGMNCIVLIK